MLGRRFYVFMTLGLVAVACDAPPPPPPGSDVLANFELGTARDEILGALPPGGLVPTLEIGESQLQNGYVVDQYLIEGTTVEVLWLHDVASGLPEMDHRANLNPLVFRDGVLDGFGWDHLDLRSEEWMLPERWTAQTEPVREVREIRSF